MSLNLSGVHMGLVLNSPLTIFQVKDLAPGAVSYDFNVRGQPGIRVQGNLNSWKLGGGAMRHMICVSTMREGCFYDCGLCDGVPGGKNFTAEEIAAQFWQMLLFSTAYYGTTSLLEWTTFGIGEPLVNKAVPEAIESINQVVPGIVYTVSTHGPKAGRAVFEQLVAMSNSGIRLDLQLSIDFLHDGPRFKYMDERDPLGTKSWKLEELGALSREWHKRTGRKPVLNFVVAPSIPRWEGKDLVLLTRLFDPADSVIKLSLESMTGFSSGDVYACGEEMTVREGVLSRIGWETQRFVLPGTHVIGGGCGALTPGLIKIAV